jgi:Cft2 family RNA processing exonuclease
MKEVVRYEELADLLVGGKDFICELGEQHGIGSSSLIIRKCGKTILIDRGIAFDGSGVNKTTSLPAGGNLEGVHIDLMIFTHVHADHAGLIVPTVLAHDEARVVFSKKTLEELKIVLADALSVQRKEAKKSHLFGVEAPNVLFNEGDVVNFLVRAEAGSYEIVDTDQEDVWITWEDWPNWDFGFTFSGHTSGAFISFIKTPDGDGIVATGDVCSHNQELTPGVSSPDESFLEMAEFRKCRRIILVTEATNGNRDRQECQAEMDTRLKTVLDETERRGGQALCPVFMVNRGPNIVAKLVRLGYKVFVAGGVRKTLRAEVEPTLLQKWLADGTVMMIQNGNDYENQIRNAAHGKYGFRPIVTSSATLDQGAGVDFAIEMLSDERNSLISTGHRFDGSAMSEFFEIKDKPIGRGHTIVFTKIERGFRSVKKIVNVRCSGHHFDYTAHSYRKGLVKLATSLSPNMVFVKHCTEDGFHGFESALHGELGENCPPVNWARHLHLFEL